VSKAKLLEVGLELKVLSMDSNDENVECWGMVVDAEGNVIEGGIREAVRRGLVMEENFNACWGLMVFWEDNGERLAQTVLDVHDGGIYGEKFVDYGRMVDGVVVAL